MPHKGNNYGMGECGWNSVDQFKRSDAGPARLPRTSAQTPDARDETKRHVGVVRSTFAGSPWYVDVFMHVLIRDRRSLGRAGLVAEKQMGGNSKVWTRQVR